MILSFIPFSSLAAPAMFTSSAASIAPLATLTQTSFPAEAANDKCVNLFIDVSAGQNHTLAVKTNGSLWAWGCNLQGQLGNGETSRLPNTFPIKIMEEAFLVSASVEHSMAVKTDGSLWTWGRNNYGQLGDGTETDRSAPVKIMEDVTAISSGANFSMAIKTDRSLWAWGFNGHGYLGDGTVTNRNNPVKIMDDVVSVSAGNSHSMAIKTDGSLWAWGHNGYWQIGDWPGISRWSANSTPVKIMEDAMAISSGGYHNLAIKTDGSLWAWGMKDSGRLGNGDADISELHGTPIKVMDGVRVVSAGYSHSMAVKTDGSLWAWGANDGRLGNGTYTWKPNSTPIKIMDNVAFVSAGSNHTMAIKTDGSLWTWGGNGYGALGDLTTTTRLSPKEIGAYDITVLFDGQTLQFNVPPQIVNGRTMVPLRAIFEALGAAVNWDNNTKTVTAKKDDTAVVLTIGSTTPTVNGQEVTIDQPAIIVNNTTLVPLRFIAEAFDADVNWNASTWVVTITSR